MPEQVNYPGDAETDEKKISERLAGLEQRAPVRELSDEEIEARFTYQSASADGALRHSLLSGCFIATAKIINEQCPPGREKASAFTFLEIAKFWASAAVARNPDTR